jgi:hypothetical protein
MSIIGATGSVVKCYLSYVYFKNKRHGKVHLSVVHTFSKFFLDGLYISLVLLDINLLQIQIHFRQVFRYIHVSAYA